MNNLKKTDSPKMETKEIIQKGNTLFVKFEVSAYTGVPYTSTKSKEFIINGVVSFQVQVNTIRVVNGYTSEYTNLIFIKFVKLKNNPNSRFLLKLSSIKFDMNDCMFVSDDSTWRLIYEWKTINTYCFDVQACIETIDTFGSFASLLDDIELTDFTLRGEDGSIRVHKAVLAASSPVFRRSLLDKWKGASEGIVDIPGTTRMVLMHFKNYMYSRVTPDNCLQQLLILSTYFMMPELEQRCIDKLVTKLTAQNTLMLSEFAVKNKMMRLHLAILECIQSGAVKVRELRMAAFDDRPKPNLNSGDRGESSIPKRVRPNRSRSRDSHASVRCYRNHL